MFFYRWSDFDHRFDVMCAEDLSFQWVQVTNSIGGGKVGNLSYEEDGDKLGTYIYTYATDDMSVKSTLPDQSFTSWVL